MLLSAGKWKTLKQPDECGHTCWSRCEPGEVHRDVLDRHICCRLIPEGGHVSAWTEDSTIGGGYRKLYAFYNSPMKMNLSVRLKTHSAQ